MTELKVEITVTYKYGVHGTIHEVTIHLIDTDGEIETIEKELHSAQAVQRYIEHMVKFLCVSPDFY